MAGAKTTTAIAGPMARIDDKAGRVKGRSTTARFMQLSTVFRKTKQLILNDALNNTNIKKRLLVIVKAFPGRKILVIGDIVADEYIFGITSRISREAPVAILRYDSTVIQPGCAANAINNIHSLSGHVIPIGVVGEDETGKKLLAVMGKGEIVSDTILVEAGLTTPVKTRIMAGGHNTTKQQMIRIDRDNRGNLPKKVEKRLAAIFIKSAKVADAIIISDYGLGTITPYIRRAINNFAKGSKTPVIVDSRYDMLKYKNITAATPNTEEMEWATGVILSDKNIVETGKKVLTKLNSKALLITRGKDGMLLLQKGKKEFKLGICGKDEVADVTGAGDTVISTFTMSLAAGATMEEATRIANYAGSVVVMKSGTATANMDEIRGAINSDHL